MQHTKTLIRSKTLFYGAGGDFYVIHKPSGLTFKLRFNFDVTSDLYEMLLFDIVNCHKSWAKR